MQKEWTRLQVMNARFLKRRSHPFEIKYLKNHLNCTPVYLHLRHRAFMLDVFIQTCSFFLHAFYSIKCLIYLFFLNKTNLISLNKRIIYYIMNHKIIYYIMSHFKCFEHVETERWTLDKCYSMLETTQHIQMLFKNLLF